MCTSLKCRRSRICRDECCVCVCVIRLNRLHSVWPRFWLQHRSHRADIQPLGDFRRLFRNAYSKPDYRHLIAVSRLVESGERAAQCCLRSANKTHRHGHEDAVTSMLGKLHTVTCAPALKGNCRHTLHPQSSSSSPSSSHANV